MRQSSFQKLLLDSGHANMSHAMAEGLRVAALSKQWVMRARNGFMGCLGIISFFDGQHSLTDDGFTLLPIAVRNASTRGLTLGPFPHPQSPRNVRRMPLPRVVSSRCMPLPIDLPYFPVSPGVANALSPCCLGREGRTQHEWQPTIARWTANDARCLVFVPPPSMSGRSKGQKWITSSL